MGLDTVRHTTEVELFLRNIQQRFATLVRFVEAGYRLNYTVKCLHWSKTYQFTPNNVNLPPEGWTSIFKNWLDVSQEAF